MTYEQFAAALQECGWRAPEVRSPYTLIDVYNRMRDEIRQSERVECRRQAEQFARRYVAENKEWPGAKAQGWAILQAADDLTRASAAEPK
jgi:hypothetical protein